MSFPGFAVKGFNTLFIYNNHFQNIVEELQAMLVEEKTSGDLRTKRLLDERARLEESIRELHKNSEVEQRKNYENLQTAKQKKAEVENIRIKLDQGTVFQTCPISPGFTELAI